MVYASLQPHGNAKQEKAEQGEESRPENSRYRNDPQGNNPVFEPRPEVPGVTQVRAAGKTPQKEAAS
jgi:hypothetical protein